MSVRLAPISRNALIELEGLFEQFQHFHQHYTSREWNVVSPSSPSWNSGDNEICSFPTSMKASSMSSTSHLVHAGEQAAYSFPTGSSMSYQCGVAPGSSGEVRPGSPSRREGVFSPSSPFTLPHQNSRRGSLFSEKEGTFSSTYHALLLSGNHPLLRGCFFDVMADPYVSQHWRMEDRLLYLVWWGFRPAGCTDCGMQEAWLPSRDGEYACAHCGVMAGTTKKNRIVEDRSVKVAANGNSTGNNMGGGLGGFRVAGRGGGGGPTGENDDVSDEDEDGDEDGDGVGEKNTGMEEGEMRIRLVYRELFHWLQRIPLVVQESSLSFPLSSGIEDVGYGKDEGKANGFPFPFASPSLFQHGLWRLPTGEDLPAVLRVAYDLTVMLTMPTAVAGSDTASLRSFASYQRRGSTPTGANKTTAFTSNAFVARGSSLYLSLLLHGYMIPFSFFVRGAGTNSCATSTGVSPHPYPSLLPNGSVEQKSALDALSSSPPASSPDRSPPSAVVENSGGAATLEWVDIEFAAMLTGIPLIDFFGDPILSLPTQRSSSRYGSTYSAAPLVSSGASPVVERIARGLKTEENIEMDEKDTSVDVSPSLSLLVHPPSPGAVFWSPFSATPPRVFPSAAAQFFEHIAGICQVFHYPLPSLLWNCSSVLPSFFNEVMKTVKQRRLPRHPMLPRPSKMNLSVDTEGGESYDTEELRWEGGGEGKEKRCDRSTAFSFLSCSSPVNSAASTMHTLPPEYEAMGSMIALAAEIDQYSLWSLGVRWVVENENKKERKWTPDGSRMSCHSTRTNQISIPRPTSSAILPSPVWETQAQGRRGGPNVRFEKNQAEEESIEKEWEKAEAYVLEDEFLTEEAWKVAECLGAQLAHWYRACRIVKSSENLHPMSPAMTIATNNSSIPSNDSGASEEGKPIPQPLYSLEVLLYPSLEDFAGSREAWRETLKIPVVERFQAWQDHFKSKGEAVTGIQGFRSSSSTAPLVETVLFTESPSANALLTIFTAVLGVPYHPLFLADLWARTGFFAGAHRCGTILEQVAQGGHYGMLPLVRRLSPVASMWMSPYFALHSMDRLPFLSALRLLHHSLHLSGKAQNVILQQLQRILIKYGGLSYYQFYFVIRVTDPREKIFNGFYFLSAVYGGPVGIAVFCCMRSGRKTITFNSHSKMISLCHYDERDFHSYSAFHSTLGGNTSTHASAPTHAERTVRTLQMRLLHGATPIVAGIDQSVTALLYDVAKGEEASRRKFHSWASVVQMMALLSHLRRCLGACHEVQRREKGRGGKAGRSVCVTPTVMYLVELAAWRSKAGRSGGGGASFRVPSSMLEMASDGVAGGEGGVGYPGGGGEWGRTVEDLQQTAPFHLGQCRDVIQQELFALRRHPSFLLGLPDERVVVLYALVVAFLECVTVKQATLQQQQQGLLQVEKNGKETYKDDHKGSSTSHASDEKKGMDARGGSSLLVSPPSKAEVLLGHTVENSSPPMPDGRRLPDTAKGVSPRSAHLYLSRENAIEKDPLQASPSRCGGGGARRRGRTSSGEALKSPSEAVGILSKEVGEDERGVEGGIADTVLNWVEELWWKEESEEDEEEKQEEECEEENVKEWTGNHPAPVGEPLLFSDTINSYGEENEEDYLHYPSARSCIPPPPSPPVRVAPVEAPSPTAAFRRRARLTMTPIMHPLTPSGGMGKTSLLSLPPLSLGPTTAAVSSAPLPPCGTGRAGTTAEGAVPVEQRKKISPPHSAGKRSSATAAPPHEKHRKNISPIRATATPRCPASCTRPVSSSSVCPRQQEEALHQSIRRVYLSSIPSFKEVLETPEEMVLSSLLVLRQKLWRAVRAKSSSCDGVEKDVKEKEWEEGTQKKRRKDTRERRSSSSSSLSSSSSFRVNSPPASPEQTPTMKRKEKKTPSTPFMITAMASSRVDGLSNFSSTISSSNMLASGGMGEHVPPPPLSPFPPHSPPSSAMFGMSTETVARKTKEDEECGRMADGELNLEAFSLFDAAACRARLRRLLHFLQAYDDFRWEVELLLPNLIQKYLASRSHPAGGTSLMTKKAKKKKTIDAAETGEHPSFPSSLSSSSIPLKKRSPQQFSKRSCTPDVSCRPSSSLERIAAAKSDVSGGKEDENPQDHERAATESISSLPPLQLPPSTKAMGWNYLQDGLAKKRGTSTERGSSTSSSSSSSKSSTEEEKVEGMLGPSFAVTGRNTKQEPPGRKKISGRKRRREKSHQQ